MRTLLRMTLAGLVAFGGMGAVSALARATCTDEVKSIKVEIKKVRDPRTRDQARKHISAADTALKRKSELSCRREVEQARKILGLRR